LKNITEYFLILQEQEDIVKFVLVLFRLGIETGCNHVIPAINLSEDNIFAALQLINSENFLFNGVVFNTAPCLRLKIIESLYRSFLPIFGFQHLSVYIPILLCYLVNHLPEEKKHMEPFVFDLLKNYKSQLLKSGFTAINFSIYSELWCLASLIFPLSTGDWSFEILFKDQFGLTSLDYYLLHLEEKFSIDCIYGYPFADWFVSMILSFHLAIICDEDILAFPSKSLSSYFKKYLSLSILVYFGLLEKLDIRVEYLDFLLQSKAKFFEKVYIRNSDNSFLEQNFWVDSLNTYCGNRRLSQEVHRIISSKLVSEYLRGHRDYDRSSSNFVLSVLIFVPFCLDFSLRLELFRSVNVDNSFGQHAMLAPFFAPKKLSIKRGQEFIDAFDVFADDPSFFKPPMYEIVYIDELGMREAGIDGGGLFRDFIMRIFKTAFSSAFGLFIPSTKGTDWYPNPNSFLTQPNALLFYKFLGVLAATSMTKNLVLPIAFADFFVKRLFGISPQMEELKFCAPELYSNLLFLKNYQGDVESLGLNFTIVDEGMNSASIFVVVQCS
jgi:hypothetical protein